MKINYLLLASKPLGFSRLINRLSDENVSIYVHVDLKAELGEFELELSGFSNIKFIQDRENVIWGDISMVRATLNLMNEVKKDNNGDSYNVLMSESDYPVKSKEFIKNYLQKNYGDIFLTSRHIDNAWRKSIVKNRLNEYTIHPVPTKRSYISIDFYSLRLQSVKRTIKNCFFLYRNKRFDVILKALKRRNFPGYLTAYGGTQWWALPTDVLNFVLDFLEKHPSYIEYHQFTHVPDEIFFHSIISSNFPKSRIRPSSTYVNWKRKGCTLPVTFSKSDLDELKNTDCLYARKFDQETSSELLDSIDKELLNTTMYEVH